MSILVAAIVTGLATLIAVCTVPDDPTLAPEDQFDFWVGEWECSGKSRTTPGRDEWQDTKATNSVTKELGGKVVEENFTMGSFLGKSVSVYDKNRKIWRQTWVDSSGGYLVFEGGMQGEKMVLTKVTGSNEGDVRQRMVFSEIDDDSFVWDWERSTDRGKTWELSWKLNYKRIK